MVVAVVGGDGAGKEAVGTIVSDEDEQSGGGGGREESERGGEG